jgi:hypothetical protein
LQTTPSASDSPSKVGFEPRNRQLAFFSVEYNSRITHAGLNDSRIQALHGRFDQMVAPSGPR